MGASAYANKRNEAPSEAASGGKPDVSDLRIAMPTMPGTQSNMANRPQTRSKSHKKLVEEGSRENQTKRRLSQNALQDTETPSVSTKSSVQSQRPRQAEQEGTRASKRRHSQPHQKAHDKSAKAESSNEPENAGIDEDENDDEDPVGQEAVRNDGMKRGSAFKAATQHDGGDFKNIKGDSYPPTTSGRPSAADPNDQASLSENPQAQRQQAERGVGSLPTRGGGQRLQQTAGKPDSQHQQPSAAMQGRQSEMHQAPGLIDPTADFWKRAPNLNLNRGASVKLPPISGQQNSQAYGHHKTMQEPAEQYQQAYGKPNPHEPPQQHSQARAYQDSQQHASQYAQAHGHANLQDHAPQYPYDQNQQPLRVRGQRYQPTTFTPPRSQSVQFQDQPRPNPSKQPLHLLNTGNTDNIAASAPIEQQVHQRPQVDAHHEMSALLDEHDDGQEPEHEDETLSQGAIQPEDNDMLHTDDNQHEDSDEAGEVQLDYPLPRLFQMGYDQIKADSFDDDPNGPELRPADRGDLADELAQFTGMRHEDQADFFTKLPIGQWEAAGDWFLGKFGDILTELKIARQEKRKAARDFEDEVEQRHIVVGKKQKLTEEALNAMKQSGGKVLEGTPKSSSKKKKKKK